MLSFHVRVLSKGTALFLTTLQLEASEKLLCEDAGGKGGPRFLERMSKTQQLSHQGDLKPASCCWQ